MYMLPFKTRSLLYPTALRIRFISTYGQTAGIKDPKVPQFLIGTDNGFLPRQVRNSFHSITIILN